ncbi:MAG: tripartite tricarboxylate transporter TctB family protein [Burkholderiaceae bacterium]|nr:MAG: tripartite tricarboxylate transporter TctB family protein [Burkholderiaceae bacterium]MBE7427404.1 tripartite tricarboxylate transporter TctB family protein [Ideonella sp.]MCC7285375.1 tripartite tricarboxylate transporter TctB family protein [Burkholderiaceae bacterium]
MKIKSQKDFWSGLLFVITGLAFTWGAQFYSFGTSARPGPGYFPFGLGLILALLGALTLFEALTIETDDGEPVGAIAWKPLLTILFAVWLFGLLLPRLGMALTIAVLVVVSSLAGDEFRWRDVLVNCVVLAIGSWAIFIVGLKLVIPLWPTFVPFGG